MKTWKLKNVEDEAKKYPDSFFIPSLEERKNIKINEKVCLHFIHLLRKDNEPETERMWVTITKEKNLFSKYKGILDNQPVYIKGLNVGDEIDFGVENIAQTIIKKGTPLWIDCAEQYALVSKLCFQKDETIRFIYREQPDNNEDSGWRIFTGNESEEYTNDYKNIQIMKIVDLLARDNTLFEPIKNGKYIAFERNEKESKWTIVEDWHPEE